MRRTYIVGGVFAFLLVLQVASAQAAVNIAVDPDIFTGEWRIAGVTGFQSGSNTVSLAAGTYQVQAGLFGGFLINVAVDGTVSVPNGISAVGGVGTLTFNTSTLSVDPADFAGEWRLSLVSGFVTGTGSVVVVPGLVYGVNVGLYGNFLLNVAADGAVTVQNGTSAIAGVGSVTFNTTNLSVNPAAFGGEWRLALVSAYVAGPDSVTVVPGVRYGVNVGLYGNFFINVAADYTVSVANEISAVGGVGTLTFYTTLLSIEPAAFGGEWRLALVSAYVAGSDSVTVVPGVRYGVNVGLFGNFFINVAADDTVTVQNGISGVGAMGELTFNTTTVFVDPGGFAGTWQIPVARHY